MHDLLIVFPVGPGEKQLALATLSAAQRCQKTCERPILIIGNRGDDLSEVESRASQIFSKARVYEIDNCPPPHTWPRTGNWAWQKTVKIIHEQHLCKHWFWWETDAVPVANSWLEKMYRAFIESGAAFGGAIVNGTNGNYMAGVGFYPVNAIRKCSNATRILDHPFDIVSSVVDHNLRDTIDLSDYISHEIGRDAMNNLCGLRTCIVHPWKSTKPVVKRSIADEHEKELKNLAIGFDGKSYKINCDYTFYHTLERHVPATEDETVRVEAAFDNWVNLYRMNLCRPAHMWEYPRNTTDEFGDQSAMPYLKDVLAFGLTSCRDEDVVVFTNQDTLIHPEVFDVLVEKFKFVDAVSSQRINLPIKDDWEKSTPFELSKNYRFSYGRDLFAFKSVWLKKWWAHIPDFILGEVEWDLVLAFLIRFSCGIKTTIENKNEAQAQCELIPGYIIHRDHKPRWIQWTEERKPARDYNIELMRQWYSEHEMDYMIKVSA